MGCCALGFVVTMGLTPAVRSLAVRYHLLDRAGQFHSAHTVAVPRLGGVALAIAFVAISAGILIFHGPEFPVFEEAGLIVASSLAMFLLGFWDDLRALGAKAKLAAQILIAALTYAGGLQIGCWENPFTHSLYALGFLDGPLTVLWLVAVTNLVNLVDGVDGLAAGLAFMLMILLAMVSWSGEQFFSMFLAVGMAGALLGFLFYNFPPARIFMGDGGAYFLGFLIAALSLHNANKGTVAAALIAPFFALGLPIIDVSFTLARRGLTGLPIFRADRRHIHHRLTSMGFSQRRVVGMLYAVCAFFLMLALGVFISQGRFLPVLFGLFMFGMILSARLFGFVQDWYKLGRLLTAAIRRRKETRYALLLGRWLEMEAERGKNLQDLWGDFAFVLQRLGFCEVTVKSDSGENHWKLPQITTPSNGFHFIRLELRGESSIEMEFRAVAGNLDEDMFKLWAELAAESWVKAMRRWRIFHASASRSLS